MKKLISFIALIFLNVAMNTAQAHSDHSHDARPIGVAEAKAAALEASKILTESDKGLGFGQLPLSWSKLSTSNTKIEKQTHQYFIVAVDNAEEKKTLFVLISAFGEIYDANFTGKFKGLDGE